MTGVGGQENVLFFVRRPRIPWLYARRRLVRASPGLRKARQGRRRRGARATSLTGWRASMSLGLP
jgi:hypothetical protein